MKNSYNQISEKGSVKVNTSKTGSEVAIKVQDTGIGISSENLQHIFDEFRQADSSTSRRKGGISLGLALVKKYSRLLGGNISVTSTLDEDSEPAIIQVQDLPEESGFKVLVARSGTEALEMVSDTTPDAIILDLMMPGIDGFQVLASIRESEKSKTIKKTLYGE